MKVINLSKLKNKDLIIFDLDGTIILSKSPMENDMSLLLTKLLSEKKVAIIGGGKYEIFQELFLQKLNCPKELLKKLFIFPTTATAFYKYNHGWKKVYSLLLNKKEVALIKKAFQDVFEEMGYQHPKKTYGEIIEDRKTGVSFSVYGQDLVRVLGKKGVKMKEEWLKNNLKTKMKIVKLLSKKLPNFEVRAAGFTTIDVTKHGIDKAYGIHQIEKYLNIPKSKMFFVGDAIFPGGNDYAVVRTGVDYMPVKGIEETKKIIRSILML